MLTKGIITSINAAGNRCRVRMPLFETAANPNPVEAEALVNIAPGIFNNLEVGDVVFVAFEENAIEKPIIIGKLFRGAEIEKEIRGGGAKLDTLKVKSSATIPASTLYDFPQDIRKTYKDLSTPKKTADYILWLEKFIKSLISQLEEHFICFKNWTQWQLRAENVEVDDGDLDTGENVVDSLQYQAENDLCKICGNVCNKNKKRTYLKLQINKNYPNT